MKFIHCINYWFVVLYYPKSVSICKNMHLPLYLRICLENEGKIDAAAVAKGPIEDSGDATMNLALIAFLCILGIQYILDNR